MCLQGQDSAVLPGLAWHHPRSSVCPQPATSQRALSQPRAGEAMGGKKGQAAEFVPAPCLFQEGLSQAQAALASSMPSSESGSKPQLKQYRKTGKENKTERLFFPRFHTLFVGCSGVGTEHSEGVFTAHPAWDGVQEACELHGASAQAAGAGPDRAKLSCLLPGQSPPTHKHESSTRCLVPGPKATSPSNPD